MLRVETFDKLADAARSLGADAVFIGGGTLIMREVNYGILRARRLLRVRDPALRAISLEGKDIVIGSGATMADICASPYTSFLEGVASRIGGPAIRNMATIGGNLFAHHPYGDLAAALLVLDARVTLANGSTMGLEALLSGRSSTGGLVADIRFGRIPGSEFRFRKVTRTRPKGISLLSIAARLPSTGRRAGQVRLAYCGMDRTPVRAKAVERHLEGKRLDHSGIRDALEAAAADMNPPDDAIASSWYRREVVATHLRRLLLGESG